MYYIMLMWLQINKKKLFIFINVLNKILFYYLILRIKINVNILINKLSIL